jgi:hypothetical protein
MGPTDIGNSIYAAHYIVGILVTGVLSEGLHLVIIFVTCFN